jgi:glycosyltransferase involved in cell wall biosynthesis
MRNLRAETQEPVHPANGGYMRATFILPHADMSGGIRVLAIYADRLRRRGHDVTVVSTPASRDQSWRRIKRAVFGQEPGAWRRFLAALSRRGERSNTNISHFDYVDVPLHVIDRFRPVTDRDVPDGDVVIATWWETAEWVAKLSPRKGAKAYFIQHYEVFDYTPAKRVKATWRLPLCKITVSKWLAELAEREYGDHKVWLVPNSVDTDQFYASPRGRQRQPTVGLLYSTTKWKGVDVSLKAFEIAAKRVPGLRLLAFGGDPVADRLPLPPGTSFYHLPAQDSIRDLYASCDVWLCGSYVEGFGLPSLEAMACRCPVVSTDAGGPADFVKSGWNGYLVPVGDVEALANRLVDVLRRDEAEWRAMSDAALATARQYTWDDATNLMESALRDIIHDAQSRRRDNCSTG